MILSIDNYVYYLFSFYNLVFCFLLFLHYSSSWLLIMATKRGYSLQSVSVTSDEKNYSYWSYVMRNFFKGKKMREYVNGAYVVPKNTEEGDVALIDAWETNNAKIITWINNFDEHSLDTQLAKYEIAKEVWDHLQRLFMQLNFTKQYQLENDIRLFTRRIWVFRSSILQWQIFGIN